MIVKSHMGGVQFHTFKSHSYVHNRIIQENQRTNGPVNAHLISGPSKAQNIKKKQFLTSIKGRNSFPNLRKTMIYNTNIDLVNDNVYTKFGLNRSISFQDIEQKPNSDVNQGP